MISDRTQFLARFYDSELRLPKIESREALESAEVERLARSLAVVLMTGSIPRRLGGDATSEELAIDKKRAKRVGHAINQSLKGWIRKTPVLPLDAKIRQEGAQLDWKIWHEAHVAEVANQLRLISTWAIQNDEERWAKSAVVRLENELNWISYAMRD